MEGKAKSFVETRLRSTVTGYSVFTPTGTSADLHNVKDHYALMPLYILVNKFKDKEYKFFINGQTGKIIGDAPIDHMRQLIFFGGVFVATWILTVLGGAFFG